MADLKDMKLECPEDFDCFELFYDTLVDCSNIESIEVISCIEFYESGTIEEITNKIKNDKKLKLCPFLAYSVAELQKTGAM